MWLTSSSIGRKFVMAITGICLVLFLTFHAVMNAVAIIWPQAYNVICMLLGANWYALIASAGLGLLVIIHIIYACWLTVQNRRARGNDRYAVTSRPPQVEWSSKNMLVLGFVIVAFLAVHLVQFWSKMQLQEIIGAQYTTADGVAYPPEFGTLFLQSAFSCVWTPIIYIVAFIALWFHMNHGFWSMFHSVGWDNNLWIQRLKCIGCWWTTIVVGLFVAQAIVFTVMAHRDAYLTNPVLQEQYSEFYEEEGKELVTEINAAMYKAQAETGGYVDQQAILLDYYDRMSALSEASKALCPDVAPSQTVAMLASTVESLKPAYMRMQHELKKKAEQPAVEDQPEASVIEETVVVEDENN